MNSELTHDRILYWLKEADANKLEELWKLADETRAAYVGQQVHLRGLIEISSYCRRRCLYCGLACTNPNAQRYRMSEQEIIDSALLAHKLGYGTVVIQSGEDPCLEPEWMAQVIRRIKQLTPLAVTLSLGERQEQDYLAWKSAGADRYLLRFETSNRRLYDRIHPPVGNTRSDRLAILKSLREMGYEIGSGVMVGIPGGSYEDLAQDIELFARLDLDMIGMGPYIAHEGTPLGRESAAWMLPPSQQVAPDEVMTCKMVALARLACPQANIPSTTALATINKARGREMGLCRGANVIMPNVTPTKYRALYEIYPSKACIDESADDCAGCVRARIASIGRTVGIGRGDRRR